MAEVQGKVHRPKNMNIYVGDVCKYFYVIEYFSHWFQQHSVNILYSATLAVDTRYATRFTKATFTNARTPHKTKFERGGGGRRFL